MFLVDERDAHCLGRIRKLIEDDLTDDQQDSRIRRKTGERAKVAADTESYNIKNVPYIPVPYIPRPLYPHLAL